MLFSEGNNKKNPTAKSGAGDDVDSYSAAIFDT